MNRVYIDDRPYHSRCAAMSYPSHTQEDYQRACETISRLTAERDELKAQVDALNGDVWRLGTKVGRLTAAFDAVRFKLEILATESELAQDALECLTSSDPDAQQGGE